jgi:hypothetical protein
MLLRIIIGLVLACFPFDSPAMTDIEACREYGVEWRPIYGTPLVERIKKNAVRFAPQKRVIVCVGNPPRVNSMTARSGLHFEYDDHFKKVEERGWSIALHEAFLASAPQNILDAVIFHEIGHMAVQDFGRCSLLLSSGDLHGYFRCELRVDRYAAKHVGSCSVAKMLRHVHQMHGQNEERSDLDSILLDRARMLSNSCFKK